MVRVRVRFKVTMTVGVKVRVRFGVRVSVSDRVRVIEQDPVNFMCPHNYKLYSHTLNGSLI